MENEIDLKTELLKNYSNYVLKNGQKPLNVFMFCENLNIPETDFYKCFSSFDSLEKEYLNYFFESTIALIVVDENYKQSQTKEKLLMFYFTFFEQLCQNRSLIMFLFNDTTSAHGFVKKMYPLKPLFIDYFKSLHIKVLETNIDKLEKYKEQCVNELAWLHLLATFQFWLKDTSPSFEKTDIFIEKSIDTSFEFTHIEPIKKMIDFGKFLWQEKMK